MEAIYNPSYETHAANIPTGTVAVFTCVTKGFDDIQRPPSHSRHHYYLFTDDFTSTYEGWITVPIKQDVIDGYASNREVKIKIPEIIRRYACSVYVDGNVKFEKDFDELVDTLKVDMNIGVNHHPRYSCVYDDLLVLFKTGVISGQQVLKDIRSLKCLQVPRNDGFYECNIIFRRHIPEIFALCERWWDFFEDGTGRDQSPFKKSLVVTGQSVTNLGLGNVRGISGKYVSVVKHSRRKGRLLRALILVSGIIDGSYFAIKKEIDGIKI